MRKILLILIICFLSKPIYAKNTSDWFKANAVCVAIDNEYSEWQKCNISVLFDDDMKVKIYADETHTIRGIKSAEEHVDESGISSTFWLGVDEKGKNCIVCIQSDQATYIHLLLTFIDDNFVIRYNLIPDD